MATSSYNRRMSSDPIGEVPPGILWYKTAAEVYEHGATEPGADFWAGIDLEAAHERYNDELAVFSAAKAKSDDDVRWLEQQDAEDGGAAVVGEFRARVEMMRRVVAWRGFGLYLDARELERRRASKGEKGIEE